MVLTENAANLRSGPVPIISRRLYDYGHAAGGVAFINYLVEVLRFATFARSALDGPLDVIIGHALRTRSLNRAAQPRIAVGIAATALGRDANFLRQLAEYLPALRVDCAFETLNLGPLTVSGHGMKLTLRYKMKVV